MIGLHAVQFGNNWLRKIPWTAKIARGHRQQKAKSVRRQASVSQRVGSDQLSYFC